MTKQRIAIDMDEVMAFTVQKIVDRYENVFGYHLTEADLAGKLVEDAVPAQHRDLVLDWIGEKGFFIDLPVMEGAQEVVYELNKNYEVFVVSAANSLPNSLSEKLIWLQQHFDFISWRNTVFCGYKSIINADYMIDDHVRNLSMFDGKGLLFAAHHNAFEKDYERVQGWQAVEKILL